MYDAYVAGRASIVGAAATHVGKVREHNEDAHFFDADMGVFLVCDGMGGHAAGEVASAIAIRTIRSNWLHHDTQQLIDGYMETGGFGVKKQLLTALKVDEHDIAKLVQGQLPINVKQQILDGLDATNDSKLLVKLALRLGLPAAARRARR